MVKISREIAKLKELAVPPLAETDDVCVWEYVPEKPTTEAMTELKNELHDQKDINAALNIELERVNNQISTLKRFNPLVLHN